jgi:parvulin-like peptidyl-prolyl isomerase
MDEEEYLVARVDGTDISASRQFKRVSSALGHTTGSDGTARFSRAAVDGLVEDFLVTRGLDKLSPPVTETDVAVALGMSEQKLQAERRRNPARIEAKLRHLSETRLMEQAGLLKVPTEDEMRAEFARRRTTRLIVVEVPVRRNVDEAQVDKQRKRAELLATAVKGGKGLGNAAAEIEGLGPRAQRARPLVLRDGDTRHLKLAQAAALLGEGETGGPVRTRKGWAVFKVVKKVEPQFEYTEVRDRLKNKLQERQRPGARRQYLRQLRKAATIEYLVEFPK